MQNAALSRRVFPYSIPQTFAGPVEEYQQEDPAHIGMMEMDECEQVIRLCRKYGKHKKEAA